MQQLGQGLQAGFSSQDGQGLQKIRRLFAGAAAQGVVNGALLAGGPEGGQVIRRKAEYRACQHRQQGNILSWIGHDLQQGDQGTDLRGFQQIRAAVQSAADALGLQRRPEGIGHGAGGAEQDHDVLRRHRAEGILLAHSGAGGQHFPDFPRREGGLLVIGIPVRDLKDVQLRGCLAQGSVRRALPQGFFRAIGQAAHPDAHAGSKHIIDAGDHLTAGAEIAAEQYLPALAGPGGLCRGIGAVFFQENLRVGQTEAVNGLLHVAHHEAVLLLLGQSGKNCILDGIGILVLVHHDLPVSLAQLPCGGGKPRAAFPQEQFQGAVLQVAEIQDAASPLEPGKIRLKLPHQADDAPGSPG